MCIAYPAQVLSVESADVAVVRLRGADQRVPIMVVTSGGEAVAPGDWLLVQTGLAVARISPDEAAQRSAVIEQGEPHGII
jgi:hydrogenase expression/formation protein HypC